MAKTLSQFAVDARGFAADLKRVEGEGVKAGALLVTVASRAHIRAASGGDMRLSGIGKRGAKVGARFDMRGPSSALVQATGPLQIVERDTAAHRIPKVRGKRAKARKRLLIPGVGVRMSAQHPGTKGKHPFEKAVNQSAPMVPKVMQRTVHKALARRFG